MIIGFMSVFITGERMSLLLFFSSIPLVLLGLSKDFTRVVINIALLFTILLFLALLLGEFFPQTYERAINSTIYKLSNFKESDYGLVYQSTYQAWLQNIWVGGGLHQLKDLYSLYDINLWVDNNGAQIKIFHAHNHPLSLLAETGLVGLFLYFLIIIQIIRKIFKESYQQDNWLKFTLLITLIYICFWPLMSHFSFQHNWMNAINWLIVGLVLALSKKMENE
jgi:O-antigen ligase